MRPIEACDSPLPGEGPSFTDFNSTLWMIYFAALKHCNAIKICKVQNQFINPAAHTALNRQDDESN